MLWPDVIYCQTDYYETGFGGASHQSHYERLGSSSVEAAFDDDWREEVENIVRDCIELSVACEDDILDRELDSAEISRCLRKLKNNKTGGSDGGRVAEIWWVRNGRFIATVVFGYLA